MARSMVLVDKKPTAMIVKRATTMIVITSAKASARLCGLDDLSFTVHAAL